jgi:hypothetical protein
VENAVDSDNSTDREKRRYLDAEISQSEIGALHFKNNFA